MRARARCLAALLALPVLGAAEARRSVSFVTCPIAQDVGPEADICFFAEHQGTRYALTNPTDYGNPQLGHQVLVEGVVTDAPRRCGGTVLDGRVSVMPELSPECDTIAPFDNSILPPPVTPERQREIETELARIATDPRLSLTARPLRQDAIPSVVPGRRETIYYPFDSDRSTGPDAHTMVLLAHLARDTPGSSIEVTAYRGASRLDTGDRLDERPGMAGQRAAKVAAILAGLGAPPAAITTDTVERPARPRGVGDWKSRRVEIIVHRPR